jgi:hypothetical protein
MHCWKNNFKDCSHLFKPEEENHEREHLYP